MKKNHLHHKERHTRQILYGEYTKDNKPLIKNKDHLEKARNYIKLREKVDRVNGNTINADLISILHLSNYLKDKRFEEATRNDMMDFDTWLQNERNLSKSTASLYLMKIKRFYKFISEPEMYANGKADQKDIKYPDSVRWITYDSNGDELPLEELPTKKDIEKMYTACKDVRDQVILSALLDGGLRKSELLSLKLRNVKYDAELKKYYFILPKKSKSKGLKTGARYIQLFLIPSSTGYIHDYLNHHKLKNNPDGPFIYSEDHSVTRQDLSDYGLSEYGISEIIDRIVKNSGVKQHITPHTLRHISATWCCTKGFNEPMLRERFGWSKRSKMPSRYVHLANSDMRNKIKEILGIKDENSEDVEELQPIMCWNCGEENPFSYNHCWKCGATLNQEKDELTTSAIDEGLALQKLKKSNPDFLKTLANAVLEQLQDNEKQEENK